MRSYLRDEHLEGKTWLYYPFCCCPQYRHNRRHQDTDMALLRLLLPVSSLLLILSLRLVKFPHRYIAVSKRVLILRTWSLIRTFLAFWDLIYISGSLFSLFLFHSRKECQFSLIFADISSSLHSWQIWFYLCLRANFHTSSFWVLILAAGGP